MNKNYALVTGASAGIGTAIAKELADRGYNLVLTARREDRLIQLAKMLEKNHGVKAEFISADLSDLSSCSKIFNFCKSNQLHVDFLVNNAGYGIADNVSEISQEQIDYGLGLLSSFILGIKYAVEPIKSIGGGCIINNSSVAGHVYGQGSPLYSALKSAVSHYTRMAGVSLGSFNIRVNAISPGAIATPIFWGGSQRANTLSDKENERKMEKLKGNLAKAVPLAKTGLVEDISEAALYLASDAGRFVTCHDLVVDGGRSVAYNEPHHS